MQALKPGGQLFITDYAKSADAPSPGFAAYIKQRAYALHTVQEYGQLLQDAGFRDVKAEDQTHLVSHLIAEVVYLFPLCTWQPFCSCLGELPARECAVSSSASHWLSHPMTGLCHWRILFSLQKGCDEASGLKKEALFDAFFLLIS